MATDTLERDPKDRRQGKTGRRSTTAWAQDIATNPQTHSERLRPTTDETFRHEQYAHRHENPFLVEKKGPPSVARGIQNIQVNPSHKAQGRRATNVSPPDSSTAKKKDLSKKKQKNSKKTIAKKNTSGAFVRGRAIAITFSIWGWAIWLWMFQFALALILIIVIGIDKSVAGSFWYSTADTVSFGAISGTTQALFAACWLLILAIGWSTMAAALVQYSVASLHPLSGRAASLKYIVFLSTLIFYIIPIANLFPWYFAYTAVVMRYPK